MKRWLMALLLALPLCAQNAADNKKYLQRVFDVKFADPNALANLISSTMRDARVMPNRDLKAISVGTYNEGDMQMAEDLVKRFDIPRGSSAGGNRNIELTAYMLMAASKGSAGEAVPADLDSVVKQLKSAFGYNDFRLLDTSVIRAREGNRVETSGNMGAVLPGAPPSIYLFNFANSAVSTTEKVNLIRIDGLKFGVRIPYPVGGPQNASPGVGVAALQQPTYQFSEIGFNTNLDLREGQKVVVGKTKTGESSGAFILVLTARAVD